MRADRTGLGARGDFSRGDRRLADQLLAAARNPLLGACLLEAGHEVEFLDGSFLSHEDILSRVGALKPDFAGIYSTTFGWPGRSGRRRTSRRSTAGY